jgi:hypothetical protein
MSISFNSRTTISSPKAAGLPWAMENFNKQGKLLTVEITAAKLRRTKNVVTVVRTAASL